MINVTADDGNVNIGNVEAPLIMKQNVMAKIQDLAQKVEGVKEVTLSIQEKKIVHSSVNPFHNI